MFSSKENLLPFKLKIVYNILIMSEVNACIRNYHHLPKFFWAERFTQAAITALAITGIINKTTFLIAISLTSAVEVAALPLLIKKFNLCPGKKLATFCCIALAVFAAMSYLPPLIKTGIGTMDYQLCAWRFTNFNIFILASYLVRKGYRLRFENENLVKSPT